MSNDGVKFSSAGKVDKIDYGNPDYIYEVVENDSGDESIRDQS
jgi:hypothetical protein